MEPFIDQSPDWIKSTYVSTMQGIKTVLKSAGILKRLDAKVHSDRDYHYWRSLLAIHQLSDMIMLDVPWWTYSAIDYIAAYLLKHPAAHVFEYGSGASTIWLAKRCQQVLSVEHDPRWYQQLNRELAAYPQVKLLLRQPDKNGSEPLYLSKKYKQGHFKQYVHAIEEIPQQYDLIVIDGRCREICLKAALPYLKPDGIIVFDNANRKRYQDAIVQSGLSVFRFQGKVPGSPFASETAILKRPA